MISPVPFVVVTLLTFCWCAAAAGDVPRPRGVQLLRAGFYTPTGPQRDLFVCLDGLKTIAHSRINDDYCDCADGSDEPGTAACPNAKFYCTNAGHRPLLLPSSRVNDGICDCCDASDEYASGAPCVDECMERGQEDRVREKERAELMRVGAQLRIDMLAKGRARKSEQAGRLAELKESHAEAQRLVDERAAIKRDAEELEKDAMEVHLQRRDEHRRAVAEREAADNREDAAAAFRLYDANADGRVSADELRAHLTFDQNRDGEVTDSEAAYFLGGEQSVDEAGFVELAWPQVRHHTALDGGFIEAPALEAGERGVSQEEPHYEQDDDDDHLQRAVDEATGGVAQLDADGDHPQAGGDEEEEFAEEEEEEEEEEETGEGTVEEVPAGGTAAEAELELDADTQQLVDHANSARHQLEEAEREVRQISTEIFSIEQQLEKDYGGGEEYAALHGQCFEYTDREYTYKVCPFDRAVQQSRNGGAETSLGRWDRWTTTSANAYATMLFTKGAPCWNGPERSLTVTVECGLESKLLTVTEPNRCEYKCIFQTPAACIMPANQNYEHDEL